MMPPLKEIGVSSPVEARRHSHSEGRLELVFARDADGRIFIAKQYASYPFHICRAQYLDPGRPGLASLYLQSCSGGLFEHDRMSIKIAAEPSAEAYVTTQAATIVHGMNGGSARQTAMLTVREGAYLEYVPDPLILFPGANLDSNMTLVASPESSVVVSDSFLTHDPEANGRPFSRYRSEIIIESPSGVRQAVDRLCLEGRFIADRRIGITGRFAAHGTMIFIASPGHAEKLATDLKTSGPSGDKALVGISLLPNSAGLIMRILAEDGAALETALRRAWATARRALRGSAPGARRK
jgi:urease accessory protein